MAKLATDLYLASVVNCGCMVKSKATTLVYSSEVEALADVYVWCRTGGSWLLTSVFHANWIATTAGLPVRHSRISTFLNKTQFGV